MRLDTIIVADAAAQAGGKLSILGVWTTRLSPAQFPHAEPSISVVVRAFVDDEDFGADHLIEVVWEGPDGVQVGMPSRFDIPRAYLDNARAQTVEGETLAFVVTSTVMGAQFPRPGLYHVVVRLDGAEADRYALPVVGAAGPAA
jgi:hypothetical protein